MLLIDGNLTLIWGVNGVKAIKVNGVKAINN